MPNPALYALYAVNVVFSDPNYLFMCAMPNIVNMNKRIMGITQGITHKNTSNTVLLGITGITGRVI